MDLAFGPSSASSAGEPTYSLLMLPAGIGTALEIRGSSSAVLVTPDQSYILLATQHSNSLLLLLPDDERGTVTSNLHETLELQRVWPALGNLPALLVDTDYAGEVMPGGETRLSWPELRELLPASDAEIQQALTRLRVLHIGGRLRLLSQSFLVDILSRLLESLDLPASLATEDAVPVVELSKGKRKRDPVKPVVAPVATTVTVNLSDSNVEDWFDLVDLSETVGLDVLAWYGNRTTGTWVLDVESIVREVGLGVLAQGGVSLPLPCVGRADTRCSSLHNHSSGSWNDGEQPSRRFQCSHSRLSFPCVTILPNHSAYTK